jgi:hypothetical protein
MVEKDQTDERGVDGKTVHERGAFVERLLIVEAAAKELPVKEYPSFPEFKNYYWLVERELIERINVYLKPHDFFLGDKRGMSRLVQISSGDVFREKVPVYLLAKGLDLIGENEIYENPPFDTRIQNGKVVGVKWK